MHSECARKGGGATMAILLLRLWVGVMGLAREAEASTQPTPS